MLQKYRKNNNKSRSIEFFFYELFRILEKNIATFLLNLYL